jgi:agmatinase
VIAAHLDTSTAELWGESYHHGTFLRHALEENLVERGQLFQLGVRATWGSADDAACVQKHDGRIYAQDDIALDGIAAIMVGVRHQVGRRPVYLTFDIDAVDPAFAPGTGTPVPGGLTSREALEIVRGLHGTQLVGMDLVEVLPALDHASMTCNLAAHLLYEGLATLAER